MTPLNLNRIVVSDALEFCRQIPDNSVDLVITSVPYFRLRDYGAEGQIGLELTVDEYVDRLLLIFQGIKRVLKETGACCVNIGDTYSSSRCRPKGRRNHSTKTDRPVSPVAAKSLMGVPWRLALRMVDDQGWILRNDIIWEKLNPKPNSVRDRFANAHEYIFFFTKNPRYYFDADAVLEPYSPETVRRIQSALRNGVNPSSKYRSGGEVERPDRILCNIVNKWAAGEAKGKIPRDVWRTATAQFKGNHSAVYPEELCVKPILVCCPPGGVVFDPFMGSGTTAVVAKKLGRNFLGCDLNPVYVEMANARVEQAKVGPKNRP